MQGYGGTQVELEREPPARPCCAVMIGSNNIRRPAGMSVQASAEVGRAHQGLALLHFSDQPKPFWSHLPVSLCLIEWRNFTRPTYPKKRAYVEQSSGRV